MAKIIVIDDDPVICEVIREILGHAGHNVVVVNSGADGIRAYTQGKPDLVITDILMPDKDGFEVLKQIRSSDRKTPVLALSSGRRALKPAFILTSSELVGATSTLSKPFNRSQLLDAVNYCLNQ